jgi:hypothetical protein
MTGVPRHDHNFVRSLRIGRISGIPHDDFGGFIGQRDFDPSRNSVHFQYSSLLRGQGMQLRHSSPSTKWRNAENRFNNKLSIEMSERQSI